MSAPALAAAFAVLAMSGPEQAQIDQIGAADPPGAIERATAEPPIRDPARAVQAASAIRSTAPLSQLNTEPPKAAALDAEPSQAPFRRQSQVNDQKASAEAPAGPPTPFPRRATVEAVSGHDACDPANPEAAQNQTCADRIESRADTFAPPPQSAEERLLAEPREAGDDARAAARRLAEGDVSNSDAAQAYVYTSTLTAQSQTQSPGVTPETQKALDAAAQLLGVLPAGAVVTTR